MNMRGMCMRGSSFLTATLFMLMISISAWGQVTLGTSPYTENFDGVAAGLPSGYTVRTGATASNLGTIATFNAAQVQWSSTTGQFANYASSDGLASTATQAQQNASTDRVIGLRQTGAFGDPGAAFVLQLANTTNRTNLSLTFSFQTLSEQGRTTTFVVDYGIGAAPTTFTSVATVTSGTFGTQTVTANFGAALDNQSGPVFIRVAALAASTGSNNRDTVAIDDLSISFSVVQTAPTITSANTATFVVGQNSTFTITTTGSPAATISITSGTLPTGLTFTNNGNGTATISGTPATGTNGTYALVFTASNGVSPDATQNFTLIVDLAPTAAGTTAGGRVTEANGRGIFRALVTVTDSQGNQRAVYTNQQGYYQFENVAGGQVYVFTAMHRRYMFDQPNQVQFIGEETDGINFIGSPFGIFRFDPWNLPPKGIR